MLIGRRLLQADDEAPVVWDPYRPAPDHLNNFGFLVTGDPGSGKTQTIRVLIDAACRADLPVVIFDFKNDYGDTELTGPLGLEVVNVRVQGLPFNPLMPPPRGASGVQPAEHAFELASMLRRVFRMGDVQEGRIREAIHLAYEDAGIAPRDWVDPSTPTWPTFDAVMGHLRGMPGVAPIVSRLAPLVDLGLVAAGGGSSFEAFLRQRVVLSLHQVPNDELKSALAELLIIQLHGHALRGAHPRRLQRVLVFDEAHRVAGSRRLEALGREGRAFGIGLIIGTQFPGDLPDELAGTMATNLFLMNGQADHRRAVLRHVGAAGRRDADALQEALAGLKPLQGLFKNAHHRPTLVEVEPHYRRLARALSPRSVP